MKSHFHFFGPVLIAIYLAFHFYFIRWTGRYFSLSAGQSRIFKLCVCALALCFPAAEYLEKFSGGGLAGAVLWFGFFWLGAMFILVCVLFLCDLLFLLLRLGGTGIRAGRMGGAAALALAACLILSAVWRGAALPKTVSMDISLRNLPAGLDGVKIVQISDLHLGRLITTDRLRGIAAQVNRLAPDLIVFTGDFTENGAGDMAGICSAVRSMNSKYGKAAVLGNHDLFGGGDNAAAFYSGCGVKMLRSEKYEPAAGLQVAGVDDLRRARGTGARLEQLVSALDPALPVIFLSHQPQGFDAVMKAGSGLVLSGHTHEGQIFPFGLMEKPLFEYFYGLYKAGAFTVYVTSGAGTWGPPMRLFTVSELPLFILHPEK